jgi:FKBP-type peptidyl-prolyl cis-trans isomerase FkpA
MYTAAAFALSLLRKNTLKQLISYCILGLSMTLAVTGCKRAETPPAAAADSVALQKIDTVAGTGKEATDGTTVVVHYTGWLYEPNTESKRGAQFDSSSGREPFSFHLGGGQVIPGWDAGVAGMKVGGKRTLIIPASMGYGSSGAGPIPPNANLIFDVELLDLR